MAQRGSNQRKQAPAYSADTMAIRYMAGLALIALGAMMFMAVELKLSGNIFEGLRRVCFGLCGILAYVLPVVPLWAGGLVVWSVQRKPAVKPWIFGTLAFLGLCTMIMVWSGQNLKGDWGEVVGKVYRDSSAYMERAGGGGAAGTVLAWPLYSFTGPVLGTLIVLILTAASVLAALNLTPDRIRDLLTGQAGRRREQQQAERELAEQQQLDWQQQEAMRQAAWQQEQQRIIEQQQMNPQPVQPVQPGPPQYSRNPVPADNGGVSNWQEQMATGRLAAMATGHQSQIFGKKQENNPPASRSFRSRIFGRGKDKEQYDGLSDGSTLEAQPAVARQGERTRRTASGAELVRPQTHWSAADEEAEAEALARSREKKAADARTPAEPAGRTARRTDGTAPAVTQEPARPAQDPVPVTREEPAAEETKPENPAPYVRPSGGKKERTAPAVPAVQQKIGDDSFAPHVTLPPREDPEAEEDAVWTPTPYVYPPITDLAMPREGIGDTREEDEQRSRKLEATLASFKVQAQVVNVTHGPAISRFELELAAGTKVNKVAELEKDIAYGMSATSVRIEAPIPGKSLVGVEVPNRKVATVTLREVLQSDRMQNARSLLTVALGKDIAGTPIVCDLGKMPHMLIAGQTGSGKSVGINAIINSLLYRAGPDELKLILIDPKVVELQCYNGIPHLLIPVVNDPHKAAAALAWAVAEMMERYDRFAERKVRNLEGYNSAIAPGEKPMSRIVIIIDELADLMMVCKKDVEEYICRLTQLARAAGIHLIVATQRPSVDVITGLIKANIPSRIAFKTASYVDSRTILDRNGAEQLLGWGDMLYAPTGSFTPTRVQGCFLSDEEVNSIVDHVKRANPCTYDPDILEKLDTLAKGSEEGGGADIIINSSDMSGGDGGLFEQAVEFAIADGQISTSTLQRRLKIGYARAGRLTDEMEERGIVAAKDGSKPRKCLITREEWEEMKKSAEA